MNKHFFELAKRESAFSTYSGYSNVKIGCVIVYHGCTISQGSNSNKSHTIQHKYNKLRYDDTNCNHYFNPSLHAEIQALLKIRYLNIDFSKIKIYVYREHKDGTLAMARPCTSCMAFIKELGIKKVYYTTNDGYAEEILKE